MDLKQPPLVSSCLDEIRVGKVSQIGFSGILSGIDKQSILLATHIGLEGISGDRQAESFHGGREKAVLQYRSEHYLDWAAEFPDLASKFRTGGFGENFVVSGMSEDNMCIGDYVRAGSALLQISESRQPCFKLNHRFGNPGIARRAQETGRTGWLYRVIEPGDVSPGDRIAVIERPLPDWPISRLQRYLYDIIDDLDMAETLSRLPHLSLGFRALFAKRVESGKAENWESRLSNGPLASRPTVWFEAKLAEVRAETDDIKSFRVVRLDGKPVPTFSAGAHINVKIRNALTRSYSICHLPRSDGYRFAVRKADDGRGGSKYIHEQWRPGERMLVSEPRNHFALSETADRHLFIAGGIGITPFLSMIEHSEYLSIPWELHYCVRDKQRAAFAHDLLGRFPRSVFMHETGGESSNRLDVGMLLRHAPLGTHVYTCGPSALMNDVREHTSHWPDGSVHFEAFNTSQPTAFADCLTFDVELKRSGRLLTVPENATLLDVLVDAGVHVESSCRSGTCGTCRIICLSGEVDHRDMCLSREGRKTSIISCISRGKSKLVLDL
ncbi:MOSC domain-containing protein [Bradyrhizobium iriomotense]|uniref:MOSC domain-containing protein n=1 Tax=Bradyrhizobium iriomotense TaxID=441950 RepID=UPI0024E10225|nr:MOSC domain-containing protein [Bradyrhizobium iriomotense]